MYDKELIFQRYPALLECKEDMYAAFEILKTCVQKGNKILLCGNGGSAADCDHIAGELLKGFLKKRPLSEEEKSAWTEEFWIADKLQKGICAINLTGIAATMTAVCNDTDPQLIYAQLVQAMGRPGDVFVGLSTSGGAKNVRYGAMNAQKLGMQVISLTGKKESPLSSLADAAIRVPVQETYMVQEYHLPVYHWLCAMLEDEFFE